MGSTFGNVLIVSSKPEWLFYSAGCQIVVAGVALALGAADYGIFGVATVMTAALAVGVIINAVKISVILGIQAWDWLRMALIPAASSIIIFAIVARLIPGNTAGWLTSRILVAASLYVSAAYLLYRKEFRLIYQEVRMLLMH